MSGQIVRPAGSVRPGRHRGTKLLSRLTPSVIIILTRDTSSLTSSLFSAGAVVDLKSRLVSVSSDVLTDLWRPREVWAQLRPHLNVRNLGQLGKLVMVLVFALLTGLIAGLKQLSNFSLKLLHELANLVDRSTPFALGALDMLTKMVGGAYLLLAMIWRDALKKQPVGPPQPGKPQASLAAPGRGPGYPLPPPDLTRRSQARPSDPGAAMDKMYSEHRNW